MTLAASGLVARLAFWQVMEHGSLSREALAQQSNPYYQQPMRGQILDAKGTYIATDVGRAIVYAAPSEIMKVDRTARVLAPVLHLSVRYLRDLFTRDAPSVLVASDLPIKTGNQVRDLALPGIMLEIKSKRTYPEKTFASQLLGFTDWQEHGQWGVESFYDGLLSGQAGIFPSRKDTAGNTIRSPSSTFVPVRNGATLHLSIDHGVQSIVEDELQKAVKRHRADSGTIIVMNPRTGYILGMANAPSYDPNKPNAVKDAKLFRNSAIQDLYEPGSTFKVVTMAAGLDSGAITPQSSLLDTGVFRVGVDVIHNWNMSGFGQENMTQVLQHSANVGASWVAQQLTTQRFYQYIRRFQINRRTGVDLADEADPLITMPDSKSWQLINLYTNSFGQGLAITPMQLIRAIGAVANDGTMMQPQIVQQIDYRGQVRVHPPKSSGRVISAHTAHTLTDMLVHSAINGEAQPALIKGYDIAAKTGTANVAGTDGKYLTGVTNASIIGYAPAYNPRFIALVIIRHPRDQPWGSTVAGPVLHDLFRDLFSYFHVPPSPNAVNK
jgi:cell division protein FtsI/penicillin-binding protein 2